MPFLSDANRAKNIKNKPRINEDPRDAQMKLLQEEINRLKQELVNAGNPPARSNQIASENNVRQDNQSSPSFDKVFFLAITSRT